MTPLTISKKFLPKDDLVIIARKQYERLLKHIRWQEELDRDLQRSLEEVKQGKFEGPFSTVEELKASLER